MALRLVPTSQFKKDYKKAKKRGIDVKELQKVLDKLCAEEPLEERHHDHALTGARSLANAMKRRMCCLVHM